MVFVFWQGIISIHQKAFLETLVKQPSVSKVLLVVEHDITPYRKNMGWDVPAIDGVEVIKAPANERITKIVSEHIDAVHIMGGIKVGEMLSTAFDVCIKNKCKLGIMTEPYNAAGFKGRLRTLKYQYYSVKYFKHIQFVLAIGKQGVNQYKALGFDPEFIFPWAYFISIDGRYKSIVNEQEVTRIIYAGRLEEGKGIYRFVEALIKSGSKRYKLDIYGTGPEKEKLANLIKASSLAAQISFSDFLKHDDLLKKYGAYDWVVLPSTRKDGWGVIISEGLLNGLKAICSNICGVSWVIKDGNNGVVFDWNTDGSCTAAIKRMLNDDTFATQADIATWADNAISAGAGVDYFLRIVDCVYHKKAKPGIPWASN